MLGREMCQGECNDELGPLAAGAAGQKAGLSAEKLTWHSARHSDIKSVLNLKIYFPVLHVTLDHKKENLVALSQGYEVSLFFVALAS